MKKLLFVCSMFLLGAGYASAQEDEGWVPKHLGIGVGIGTTGINIDASTMVNKWFGIRAGVDIVPQFKYSTSLDLSEFTGDAQTAYSNYKNYANITGEIPKELDVEGKTSLTTGHFLIDVYPFPKKSSFHLTAGAYFGSSKIIKVYNTKPDQLIIVNQWNDFLYGNSPYAKQALANGAEKIGYDLGDYFLEPKDGHVEASIKVASFRPYLGIGFGRAVPRKRIGAQFDLGVQFWGSPAVYAQNEKLTESNTDGDSGEVLKTLSKITVYPVLNFRLVGRIF